jgi:hypothetical protein
MAANRNNPRHGIAEGTRVRLTDPPGTQVPYGAVGIAEGAPADSGLFWAQFPQGRMHTRVSEVEILAGDPDLTEIERLLAEIADLDERLDRAHAALQAERFKGVPRFSEGDVVLVPRNLFGKVRMTPAQIGTVHLDYSSGTFGTGEPWENKTVSYSVYFRQQDGTFGGGSQGYYHDQVQPAPQPDQETPS